MSSSTRRDHALDAARAILMLLGIPFHAANIYRLDHEWFVSSAIRSEFVTGVAHFIHVFRMEAFFLIAGYFSLLLIRRSGARGWFASRLIRLGVPLVTGIAAVNTLLELVSECIRAPPGSPQVLGHAIATVATRFTQPGPHYVRHLWFLPDLLLLSALFAIAWHYRRARWLAALCRGATRLLDGRPAAVIPAALVAGGIYKLGLVEAWAFLASSGTPFYGAQHVHKILGFSPFFALGVLLASRQDALARFARPTKLSAMCAFLMCGLVVVLQHHHGTTAHVAAVVLGPSAAALMTHAVLAGTTLWFGRPSRVVGLLVDASFTVYIVHLPVVAVLGLAAVRAGLGPIIGFALVVVTTVIVSVLAHSAIRRHRVALFLFNGIRARPRVDSEPGFARVA